MLAVKIVTPAALYKAYHSNICNKRRQNKTCNENVTNLQHCRLIAPTNTLPHGLLRRVNHNKQTLICKLFTR